MNEFCPHCNQKIEHLQEICENCGVKIEWLPKYKKGKFLNPFWDDMYVLKGKGLQERPKTRTW